MRSTLAIAVLLTAASLVSGQAIQLTTTFAGGNGQSGAMFDVDVTAPIDIVQFDVNLDTGITVNIEVWVITGGGTYVGNETNAAGWTNIATFNGIVSAGDGVPTPLPILPTPITLTPGLRQGIYVTINSGSGMNYTNGSAEGALFATDGTLNFYEGRGASYPFGGTFVPRVFNGNIYYVPSGGLTSEYQENSDHLGLLIDGGAGSEFFARNVTRDFYPACSATVNETVEVALTSNAVGTLYDLAISNAPVLGITQGALSIPGLRFNIDPLQPYTFIGSGSVLPGFLAMPGSGIPGLSGSSWFTQVGFQAAGTLTLQAVSIDPASPSGIGGTAPGQIDIVAQPVPTSVIGPNNSSTNVTVDVVSTPTCWTTNGIPFYGTVQNELFVSPNGFVCFGGGGDTDTTPSILDATSDDGRVGFWTSFDPSEGGTVDILSLGTDLVRIEYNGVSYDGLAGATTATFSIEIDANTGGIVIGGLQGIQANPTLTSTTDDQWLGISPGLLGPATDPGGTPFSVGGGGGVGNPFDMLYEFNDVSVSASGLPASISGGLDSLFFFPDGSGNYTWAGI